MNEQTVQRNQRKENRLKFKFDTFIEVLLKIKELSVATTTKVACIALRKDFSKIASFGYNGSYSGAGLCDETGTEEESNEPGESGFIHAEVNMIAKFKEHDPENYIIILTLSPCKMCTKILVNAGFKNVYWIDDYRKTDHLYILKNSNIMHGNISKLLSDYSDIIS